MSTPAAEVLASRSPSDIDPAERGRTHLDDRVVEKIAAQAASEVEHTVELSRRLADRLPGRSPDRARVAATVSGHLVQLRVDIAVEYPTPVVQVTRAVRAHVSDVVTRLCGVEVRDVDVEVTALRRAAAAARVS